jgi:hypothetical protein
MGNAIGASTDSTNRTDNGVYTNDINKTRNRYGTVTVTSTTTGITIIIILLLISLLTLLI